MHKIPTFQPPHFEKVALCRFCSVLIKQIQSELFNIFPFKIHFGNLIRRRWKSCQIENEAPKNINRMHTKERDRCKKTNFLTNFSSPG